MYIQVPGPNLDGVPWVGINNSIQQPLTLPSQLLHSTGSQRRSCCRWCPVEEDLCSPRYPWSGRRELHSAELEDHSFEVTNELSK